MGTNNLLQAAKHMPHGLTEPHELEENVPTNTDCRKEFFAINKSPSFL